MSDSAELALFYNILYLRLAGHSAFCRLLYYSLLSTKIYKMKTYKYVGFDIFYPMGIITLYCA